MVKLFVTNSIETRFWLIKCTFFVFQWFSRSYMMLKASYIRQEDLQDCALGGAGFSFSQQNLFRTGNEQHLVEKYIPAVKTTKDKWRFPYLFSPLATQTLTD